MLAVGRLDLLQSGVLSGLYDAQAHRLLAGHWDVPLDKLTFEAFLVHGKTYMYFGPWPAVLRLPIAALTDRFDGELTQLSMIAAFVVLLVATSRLLWRGGGGPPPRPPGAGGGGGGGGGRCPFLVAGGGGGCVPPPPAPGP